VNPLYIIPARGGSKGVPHKNVRPLAGRPLLHHTISAAIAAGAEPARILVSTDDPAIADCARAAGLDVPFMRPAELATDTAGSREVMLHAMDCADTLGIGYDCVVLLQPTSPLRSPDDIRGAIALYAASEDCDMVVSVTESPANPYYDCFETDPATGLLHVSKGDGRYTRRQDAPKAWQFNGAVYVIRPASLRAMPLGAFPRRIPYPMPPERSIDIDSPLDWLVAEALIASK